MLTRKYQRALANKILYVMDAVKKDTQGKHVICLEIKGKSSQPQGVL